MNAKVIYIYIYPRLYLTLSTMLSYWIDVGHYCVNGWLPEED